jgi:hypothetical protein
LVCAAQDYLSIIRAHGETCLSRQDMLDEIGVTTQYSPRSKEMPSVSWLVRRLPDRLETFRLNTTLPLNLLLPDRVKVSEVDGWMRVSGANGYKEKDSKGTTVALNEEETRFHLIDPVLRRKGYDDPQRIRLETPAPVEPIGPKGRRRRGAGRTDYLLCVQVGTDALETPVLWAVPEIAQAGGLDALRALGKPADVMQEAKARLFGV